MQACSTTLYLRCSCGNLKFLLHRCCSPSPVTHHHLEKSCYSETGGNSTQVDWEMAAFSSGVEVLERQSSSNKPHTSWWIPLILFHSSAGLLLWFKILLERQKPVRQDFFPPRFLLLAVCRSWNMCSSNLGVSYEPKSVITQRQGVVV